jgi:hypothetical protein
MEHAKRLRAMHPFRARRDHGHLGKLQPDQIDILRCKLCIGVHRDVEVTDAAEEHRPVVSQVFCSALSVAYSRVPSPHWKAFASLVLQAAYEATPARERWGSPVAAQYTTLARRGPGLDAVPHQPVPHRPDAMLAAVGYPPLKPR